MLSPPGSTQKILFFDIEGRLYEDQDLLRFCPVSILIGEDSTRRISANGEKHRKVVQLAHFSVKEYLQIRHEFELPVASLSLAKTMLAWYILNRPLKTSV